MIEGSLRTLKTTYRFLMNDVIFGALLYRYGVRRHEALLQTATRSQRHTYTRFHRSPGQLAALAGPVVDKLLQGNRPRTLAILVFASSTGAEPYTIASVLRQRRPELEFKIIASDLHPDMVRRGQRGAYHRDEVNYWGTPHHFVRQTFDAVGGIYVVKPEIRKIVEFEQANLLDDKITKQFARSDLVFMQNVLCHLDEEDATRAFQHAVQLLKPRSGLFIDGMNLDLREKLTAEADLVPLDYKCREIHEFSRTHIGNRWWNYYYGIEPYAAWHASRLRRYSTIFMREHDGKQLRPADLRHDGHEMIAEVLATYLSGATGRQVSANDDLLGGALNDEADIVNLVSFAEDAFDVVIDPEELRSCNFQSLNEVAALIRNGASRTHWGAGRGSVS